MAKMYINPKTLNFGKLEDSEVEEFYGWVDAENYVRNLQTVIREALEDANDSASHNKAWRMGYAEVTWITLNKAKRFLEGLLY